MKFSRALRFAATIVGLLWIIHILRIALSISPEPFAIHPRHTDGLIGIFTAPFMHGGYDHLFSNSIPLLFLIVLLLLAYSRSAIEALWMIYIGTGVAMWIFIREANHIGASGVVYGLISFLFWTGVFRKNLRSIVISLVIIVLYSDYIWGIFPGEPGISWDGHLAGATVGILVAYLLRKRIEIEDEPTTYRYLEEEAPKRRFFDEDIFD